MIQVKDENINYEGNLVDIMTEFVAIVGWLRFEKHIPEGIIEKLVTFGLDRDSFDELGKEGVTHEKVLL